MNRWQAELAALSQKGGKSVTSTLLNISLTNIIVKKNNNKKQKTTTITKTHNRTFNKTHYNESTALERPVMNYLRSG